MKKIIFSLTALIAVIFISGCTLFQGNISPTRTVESFFSKYQSLDKDVMDQLNDVVNNENFTDTQKNDYRNLMKKQYQNLTYIVKDDAIDGNNAIVTTEIEVYDFATPQTAIDAYVETHREEFLDDKGNFSNEKYTDYKIDQLQAANDRIKYTLDLKLAKAGNEWKLDDLSDVDRQKIQGVYVNT